MKAGDLVKFASKDAILSIRRDNLGTPIIAQKVPEKTNIGFLVEYDDILKKATILYNETLLYIHGSFVEKHINK
jgi:hypothetical protein